MGWREKLTENIVSISELSEKLGLSPAEIAKLREVEKIHPVSITRYYLSLIDLNNREDPLRKMLIPSICELNKRDGTYDTSGEKQNTVADGVQHKYDQTVLILATNACSQYCRFCFRKRLVGLTTEEIADNFEVAYDYIKDHPEVTNVLISGGDSFMLPTSTIDKVLTNLQKIEHLKFIRFGTRMPVAFPERINSDLELLKVLKKHSKKDKRIHVMTHYNHPREISEESITAVDNLLQSGVIMSNQTVLMKDVNDNPETLVSLFQKLVGIGVNPYYLFQCRPVKRVKHHFQVPLYRGYKIVENAKKMLSGPAKRFKYCMSHFSGKVEILGLENDDMYFRYNQARYDKDLGRFFKLKTDRTETWLDDFKKMKK